MQEYKYMTYNWLKYNANLLKKRKYYMINIFSFVKLTQGLLKVLKQQPHASTLKRNYSSINYPLE